jgi:hypothetical protein
MHRKSTSSVSNLKEFLFLADATGVGINASFAEWLGEELACSLVHLAAPRLWASCRLHNPQSKLLLMPVHHAVCAPRTTVTKPSILVINNRS